MTSSSVASSRLNVNTPSTLKSILSPRYSSGLQHIVSTTADISRPSSSHPSTTDRTITYRTPDPGGGSGLHTSTRSRRTSGASTVTISIRTTPSHGGDKCSSLVSD
jgi:hypothetical protein